MSTLQTLQESTFEISSLDALVARAEEIRFAMEHAGYCVLRPWNEEYATLKTVAGLFGDIQSHIRANTDGIVAAEGTPMNPSWAEHRSEYAGVSEEEFAPHTDGTFLNGAYLEDERLVRVGPPPMMLLQSLRRAAVGGEIYVVDEAEIFREIVLNRPDMARILMSQDCFSICRDDQMALGFPVWERISASRFRVRFRIDSKVFVPDWALDTIRELHRIYHCDPRFKRVLDLQPGDILAVDNYRVLHGRNAFRNAADGRERRLRRVWINYSSPQVLTCAEGTPSLARCMAAGLPYRRIPNRSAGIRLSILLGIPADEAELAMAERIMMPGAVGLQMETAQ
jgi:alpha-ketoglutarate-dependent taurine dioxygenase